MKGDTLHRYEREVTKNSQLTTGKNTISDRYKIIFKSQISRIFESRERNAAD